MTRGVVCQICNPLWNPGILSFEPNLNYFCVWGRRWTQLILAKHTSWLEGKVFKGLIKGIWKILGQKWLLLNNGAELSLSESETYILNFPWNPHGYKNVGKGGLARCSLPNQKCLKTNLSVLVWRITLGLIYPSLTVTRLSPCLSARAPWKGASVTEESSFGCLPLFESWGRDRGWRVQELLKICVLTKYPGDSVVVPLWRESYSSGTLEVPL